MNIEINSERLQSAVSESMGKAVDTALRGYDVQAAIAKTIGEEIGSGAVAQAIRDGLAQIDGGALARALAGEIARSVTSATVLVVREALATAIIRLRGGYNTQAEERTLRARVIAEIEAAAKPEGAR